MSGLLLLLQDELQTLEQLPAEDQRRGQRGPKIAASLTTGVTVQPPP